MVAVAFGKTEFAFSVTDATRMTLALPDVLATKVGRLVAAEFADPARLAALGSSRFILFGATRGLQIRKPMADRLVQAARDARPTADAVVARAVLAADLTSLADLDAQVDQATDQLARLLPVSPFAPLAERPAPTDSTRPTAS